MSGKRTKGAWIKRIFGICLMIFSVLGLAISLVGLPAVSRVSEQIAKSTDQALALTLTTLGTTGQSLALAHDALGEARDALGAAQTVVEGVDDGLQNTEAMIDSVGDTLTNDLSQVIENTQDSVAAAGKGAAMIEDVLYDLSAGDLETLMASAAALAVVAVVAGFIPARRAGRVDAMDCLRTD